MTIALVLHSFEFAERRLELSLPFQRMRKSDPDVLGTREFLRQYPFEQHAGFQSGDLLGQQIAKFSHDVDIRRLHGQALAKRPFRIHRIASAKGG